MRRLRYWFTATIPKINYFNDIIIHPIDYFVKSLHHYTSIQNRSSFKVSFGWTKTGIITKKFYNMIDFRIEIRPCHYSKFLVNEPCRIADFLLYQVMDYNFHTASISNSVTRTSKGAPHKSFLKSSSSSRSKSSMSQ